MNISDARTMHLRSHTVGFVEAPGPSATSRPASTLSEATPIVLLHGGAVDHRMWTPQLAAFPGHRVIAPDARGHGSSSDASAPYRLADDVVELFDALDVDRAVLVGVSMGGGTAVDVALEHPSRVAGLVVSGTGTSEPEFADPWMLETFEAWEAAEAAGDPDAWIEAFMRFAHGPHRSANQVDPAVWVHLETMTRETLGNHVATAGSDGTPLAPTPPTR